MLEEKEALIRTRSIWLTHIDKSISPLGTFISNFPKLISAKMEDDGAYFR